MKRRFNRQQRTTARLGVVQMLFVRQKDEQNIDISDILKFFEDGWEKPDLHFMQSRLSSVFKNRKLVDDHILTGLQAGWSLERIDPVLYAILSAATDEILNNGGETPIEILIKEYVDLTRDFFDSAETAFVNAYLNDLKHKIRSTSC